MTAVHSNQLRTIDAQALKQGLDQQTITLIDVREPAEYSREHIPGAVLVPLFQFEPGKISQADGKQLVLYCRLGHRSAIAAQKLLAAGSQSVAHLSGGMGSWTKAGYPTIANRRTPISLMRQVQIVAGSLVLTGTLLGAFVSPWFLLLSGFVGAGLILAGVTDTCLLAGLLARLPYNQGSVV